MYLVSFKENGFKYKFKSLFHLSNTLNIDYHILTIKIAQQKHINNEYFEYRGFNFEIL